jgi:hypothetical protein
MTESAIINTTGATIMETHLGSPQVAAGSEPPNARLAVAWTELSFVALPVVIRTMVSTARGASALEIAASPEWGSSAVILFGLSIVGMTAVAHVRRPNATISKTKVAIAVSFGLVPSVVVTALMSAASTISPLGVAAQFVALGAAVWTFLKSADY